MVANLSLYGDEAAPDSDDAMQALNKIILRAREITAEEKRAKRPEIKSN